jgi:ATP-dependent Clp protease ATP-binding subunit ClpB
VQREIGDRLAKALLAGEIHDGDSILVDSLAPFGESSFEKAGFGPGAAGISGLTVRRMEPGEVVEGIQTENPGSGGADGSDLSALPGW